jgi:glutathione reductase (NADPH)
MPTRSFDVVILGGGNAGMGVTVAPREAGLSVAMIEPDLLGGTCPNRGCMPKKVLVAAAHALDEIERAKAHHITVGKPSLDWAALIHREKAIISGIPASLGELMKRRGVEVIRERGRFTGPNAVAVGGDTLEAKHIVIATGSKPRKLPFPGAELTITSDNVLSERNLPASVVFIGGGVIALEFSHVYARAGAKVTILEVLPRLLDNMDADAVAQLRTETERIGVAIHTGVEVQRVEKAAGRLRVVYAEDGSEHSIEAERVVNGAGRLADLDDLDLPSGRVEVDRVPDCARSVLAVDFEPGGTCLRRRRGRDPAALTDSDLSRAERRP